MGIGDYFLQKIQKFLFFMTQDVQTLCQNLDVTENQLSVVAGGLLGDSTLGLRPGGKARLKVEHGTEQTDYVQWKLAQLPEHLWSNTKGILKFHDSIKNSDTIGFQTNSCFQLVPLHELFYVQNDVGAFVKTITPTLLSCLPINPILLAVWFCDDGSIRNDCYAGKIATMCFSQAEHVLLQQWLGDSFGVYTKIVYNSKSKQHFYLSIPAKEFGRFADLIRPTVLQIPGMEYKLNDARRSQSKFF